MTGNDGNEWESIANVKGICTWKPIGSKPKPNKPDVKKSKVVQARVVAEFKPNYIRYDEYEWADDQLKSISIFKKNQIQSIECMGAKTILWFPKKSLNTQTICMLCIKI